MGGFSAGASKPRPADEKATKPMLSPLVARARLAFEERRENQRRSVECALRDLLHHGEPKELGFFLAELANQGTVRSRPRPTRLLIRGFAGQFSDPLVRALLERRSLRRRSRGRSPAHRPRLLVLERGGMAQDLNHGLLEQDWPGTLAPIQRGHVKLIVEEVLGQTPADFFYFASTTLESRARLRDTMRELLKALFERTESRTLLSANIAYWSDQELSGAAHDAGGRFLVLHKETLITATAASFSEYSRALRAGVVPSPHRQVAVYSESTAEAFVKAEVAEPEQIHIVGAARLDAAHSLGRRRSSSLARRLVTFFTFHDWIGISFPSGADELAPEGVSESAIRWTETLAGFYKAADLLATSRRDILTVVKHKSASGDSRPEVRDPAEQRPIIVSGGEDALSLIASSAVCVAFNSTVILEAIAARVPVIVPAFGEAAFNAAQQYIIDFGSTVHRAESPEQLASMAAWFVDNPSAQVQHTAPGASDVLARLVGNPDGASGMRLQRFLEDHHIP